MEAQNYAFVWGRFQDDLKTYLDKNSCRELSKKVGNSISPSGISRLSTGKKKDLSSTELAMICSVIGKSPCDYFDRVLWF